MLNYRALKVGNEVVAVNRHGSQIKRLDEALKHYIELGYKNEPFTEALCRAAYKTSQSALAKECGVTYQSMHGWFLGTRLPSSLFMVTKLETLLDVPVGYFYVLIARDKLLTGDNNDDK